jgi:hypothetical protein
MNAARPQTARKRIERGYALLVVVFLLTVLFLSTMVVMPNILTEGQREKEKEMIWRGNQYVRGVKLHFRKTGRFPTTLDDLTKPKVGSLRFMRQAYKDPMNKEDGSWRFIYVGPAGQLIGSLKPPQNLQLPKIGGVGTPANALSGPGTPAQPGAAGQQATGGTQPDGTAAGTNPPATTGTPVGTDQSDAGSNPQPIPSGDTSAIIGGNIIGVGSKINKSSVIVYDKAKNYHLFEFIWDPSRDRVGVGQQPGLQTGTGLGQQGGLGGSPGSPGQPTGPTTPQPNPQQPPQNPPPQQ